eukprot:SAG31_NODE_2339_length_5920_cov_15.209414_1_plen_89_part_00
MVADGHGRMRCARDVYSCLIGMPTKFSMSEFSLSGTGAYRAIPASYMYVSCTWLVYLHCKFRSKFSYMYGRRRVLVMVLVVLNLGSYW